MPKRDEEVTVQIDDAQILYRNFSGNKTAFNPAGDRNFCVYVPDGEVDNLVAQGWNVKFTNVKEEGDEPRPYIPIKLGYQFKAPRVVLITSAGKTPLTEDTVKLCDVAEFKKIDLIFRNYDYDFNGTLGRKAYLKTFVATIFEDELERRYGLNDTETINEED